MPADLEAFLASITTFLAVPGVNAAYIPMDLATAWLIESNRRLSFVQAEASDYGLLCKPTEKKVSGKTSHFLKFEKEKPCPKKIMPAPRPSATETEPSTSEIG